MVTSRALYLPLFATLLHFTFTSPLHPSTPSPSPAMSSGITVSPRAKATFDEVRKHKMHRFIILHIRDDKEIDVESVGPRDATYDDFLRQFSAMGPSCRYAVVDFPAKTNDQGSPERASMQVDRLILIQYCPDNSTVRHKIMYTSSVNALKKDFEGLYKYIQACGLEEVAEGNINDILRSGPSIRF